jgi:hypothetical protein
VVPSLKVIVPLGVKPAAVPVTIAVKVTGCPYTALLAEDISVVVLLACVTIWVSCAVTLEKKFDGSV